MPVPTVAVNCTASDQNGNPVAGAVIRAKLDRTEIYQGFVVPEIIEVKANSLGVAVLNLWPNALGTNGSIYTITATNPDTGKKFLNGTALVPNSACNLHQILMQEPYPTLDASQQALAAAQGALAPVTAQVALSTAQASLATTQATNSANSATASAGSATAAAASAVSASTSATNASTSAGTAATQAGTATTQAGVAAAKASESATSATNASGSATSASTSAGTATSQAVVAASQAVLADDDRVSAETAAAQSLTRSAAAALSQYDAGLSKADALTSKNAAALSSAAATTTQTAINHIYRGALAADPATRVGGAANQLGDEYFNTTTNRKMIFRATGWLDFEVSASASATASEISRQASVAQANTSTTQAGISTTQASLATTAKTAAEAARDAANTSGKVFTSTALGIAGTTSGQSFSVLSTDLQDLIVYTNAAGTATELLRFKTKVFIDSLGFDTSYSDRVGYAAAWLDVTGALALGIRGDGKIIFGKGGDIAAAVAANAATLLTLPTQLDTAYIRSGYTHVVMDSQGNIAWGLDAAGQFLVKGLPVAGATAPQVAQIAVNTKWVTPSGFFASGDSLTAGSGGTPYPTQLATLLGKPVTNFGIGGQSAQAISGRFGGSVPFVTITGNTIPASGAVAVTAQNFQIHNNQGPGSVAGTLAGIPGSLNATAFDGGGVPTAVNFTRTTAGSALVIDSSTAFIVDTSDNRQFGTVVFWYGRNNAGSATFNADVKLAIADAVGQLKPIEKRFVVMSILNTNAEVTGSGTYLAITQLNNDLRALYPRNFIDIRALLVRSGTGTGQDSTDTTNDVIPASLRADSIHLNTSGYGVVASAVFNFLTTKGWLA